MLWAWTLKSNVSYFFFQCWKAANYLHGSIIAWQNLAFELHLLTCEKHILSARARRLSFCSWVLRYEPQTEMLLHLWQIEKIQRAFVFKGSCGQTGCRKSLVGVIWVTVEYTGCDIISSEIAIQESLWSFYLRRHLWVLVLEGLPPHLLPLIRWIKPLPINFSSLQLLSWLQLPT